MVPFYHDEPGYKGWGYIDHLQPHAVFPAPPLFRPPVDTPSDVQQQLQLAFQLYWVDLAASIGRLRTAVEQMLDDQNIPRDKGSASGKTTRMDLASRIDVFAATANGSDSKDALDALRHIGNLGTHGTAVSDEAFFDAVDVLEDVLLGVYDKKSIKAKITKLNSSKGKY
ncbi:hypothetical protein K32_03620 [Kaistia sp. 32K]|uniref:DUF4145 domain-containing protein n=1 Tax=Kaistia sp. 32K TaxID=2795690 RepID=UPI0019164579|nr:DUF4145 domain-containing protein [Kaistia sp. 32K]BCP51745.1 hypothetical protein K32_03620 [Kaistia sp. 32K]